MGDGPESLPGALEYLIHRIAGFDFGNAAGYGTGTVIASSIGSDDEAE